MTHFQNESLAKRVTSGLVFAHRENRDGTFDSICMKCFATVASSLKEAELEQGEQKHWCDPLALARLSRSIRVGPGQLTEDVEAS